MSSCDVSWKNLVNFLIRLKLVPENFLSSVSSVVDLVILLRDGVILCELVNQVVPNAISPSYFCKRPQSSQFLSIRNIKIFLQSCKEIFDLQEGQIFSPSDLYDMKDFNNVLNTLSLVSQSSHFKNKNIQPFYCNSEQQPFSFNDNETLNSFRTICEKSEYGSVHDKEEGEVYGKLVDLHLGQSPQPHSTRDRRIMELVDTEKNFIDALYMIQQQFMIPLKECLEPHHLQTIFFCIEDLYKIHTGFYYGLEQALKNLKLINSDVISSSSQPPSLSSSSSSLSPSSCCHNNQLSIPDCFVIWKEKFLIYGDYCSNLLKAQNLLDELCKNDVVIRNKVEKSQQEANQGMFKLRDLLSLPLQRVLKYMLFVDELIKSTDRTHHELKSLGKAREEILDLSLYVNEVKRDHEMLLMLDEISKSIVRYQMPENVTLKDYGRLLKDGELKLKSHSDNKTKTRYAFLFDKVLLFCKAKGESCYSFKGALVVSSFEVEDSHLREKEKNFVYSFILGERSKRNAYTIGCKTIELKNKWVQAIKSAQYNVSPPFSQTNLHSFEMTSFDKATICDVCRKLLRGLYYQGYQCQKTQMVVHKECIEKAKYMPGPPELPPKPSTKPAYKRKVKVIKSYNGNPQPPNFGRPLILYSEQFVEIISDDNIEWLEGRIDGQEGIFPASCVQARNENGAHNSFHYTSTRQLEVYPWFAGNMSREEASKTLSDFPDGSFLLRVSMSESRKGELALSIKYGRECPVKHIKVQRNKEGRFFIADSKVFKTIPEMISYYSENSLQPSFYEVPTTLLHPFKLNHPEEKSLIDWSSPE